MTNRRVLLRNRPVGEPKPSDFEIVDAPLPEPQDGDILVRTIWLSLDPYMRGRMNDVKSSAAPGAVGSVVGQLAKIRGCRVAGIAGTKDKCEYALKELGFDACVSHRVPDLAAVLRDACPNGIDVYFDNVGGEVLKAVLKNVNPFARIPLCGIISQYNATEMPPGPNLAPVLVNRVTIRGFLVSDHTDRRPQFLADCSRWLREGKLKYREDIVQGLEKAAEAFIGLLRGQNTGKMLVKVGEDPTRR